MRSSSLPSIRKHRGRKSSRKQSFDRSAQPQSTENQISHIQPEDTQQQDESQQPVEDPTPTPQVLFECKSKLSTGLFDIRVTQTDTHLFINADKIAGGENYVIELAEENVETILGEFQGDLEQMCSNLEVLNKRLVLLNPKAKKKKKRKRTKSKKKT